MVLSIVPIMYVMDVLMKKFIIKHQQKCYPPLLDM